MAKKKFYVVWVGRKTGVFDTWEDCQESINGFPGARYKGFDTSYEATQAYRAGSNDANPASLGNLLRDASGRAFKSGNPGGDLLLRLSQYPEIDRNGWAVDASCLGNPGIMEYRGVDLSSGKEIFRVGPFSDATNNIGEYLAIVHALALMAKQNRRHTIYSDSKTAQGWVRKGLCNTKIVPTPANAKVRELIMRADHWLATHTIDVEIIKWDTKRWGEIPADFGRK